mgnify:CR=1 FL=1
MLVFGAVYMGAVLIALAMIFWQAIMPLFSRPKEAIKRGGNALVNGLNALVNGFPGNPPLYLAGLVAFALGVVGELETVAPIVLEGIESPGPHPYYQNRYFFGLATLPTIWTLCNRDSWLRKTATGDTFFFWAAISAITLTICAAFLTVLMELGMFLAETFVG